MNHASLESTEPTPCAPSRKPFLAIVAAVVVLAAGVCIWFAFRPSSRSAKRIRAILEYQSPDDFNPSNARELSLIAQRVQAKKLNLDSEALSLLIRAFTFGWGQDLKPDYDLASALFKRAADGKPIESLNADLVFLRATILARTADSKEDCAEANRLLDSASGKGSVEAQAKKAQGGFYFVDNKRKKTLLQSVLSAVTDIDQYTWLALDVPLGVAVWNMILESFFADSSTDLEKTIRQLRMDADLLDPFVADRNVLLAKYDTVRTASILAHEPQDNDLLRRKRIDMLLGRQGGAFLGSPNFASSRRVIVCTDQPCLLFECPQGGIDGITDKIKDAYNNLMHGQKTALTKYVPHLLLDDEDCRRAHRSDAFLAMPAGDIECYNREIEQLYPGAKDKTLHFDRGHPQNGYTYVQHPHRKNEYIELSEFSVRMLKEKAAELDRVLSSLGAKEIRVSVFDYSTDENRSSQKVGVEVNANNEVVEGKVDVNSSFYREEKRKRQDAIHFESKRKGNKPVYPEGPGFPFFNEPNQIDWQTLAKDVCDGKRDFAKFRLAYADDYRYDSEAAGNLGIAVKNGIQSGSVGVTWKIQTSLHLNKCLVWECEASF